MKNNIIKAVDALLKCSYFLDTVQPLLLPESGDINHEGQLLVMASWGYFSDDNMLSDVLRATQMEVISQTLCATVFPPPLITSSVICTQETQCSGDSGSMLVQRQHDGRFVAIGIASFSYDSCSEENSNPSVFMRVGSYLDFINENIDLKK